MKRGAVPRPVRVERSYSETSGISSPQVSSPHLPDSVRRRETRTTDEDSAAPAGPASGPQGGVGAGGAESWACRANCSAALANFLSHEGKRESLVGGSQWRCRGEALGGCKLCDVRMQPPWADDQYGGGANTGIWGKRRLDAPTQQTTDETVALHWREAIADRRVWAAQVQPRWHKCRVGDTASNALSGRTKRRLCARSDFLQTTEKSCALDFANSCGGKQAAHIGTLGAWTGAVLR